VHDEYVLRNSRADRRECFQQGPAFGDSTAATSR